MSFAESLLYVLGAFIILGLIVTAFCGDEVDRKYARLTIAAIGSLLSISVLLWWALRP